MTTWIPDTCDCRIVYNERIKWVETLEQCRLHKSLNGQNLLDIILAQNRRFNLSLGIDITDIQSEKIVLSKHVNKLRIRVENLVNFDEHLPHEESLTFFQNLRRILRI